MFHSKLFGLAAAELLAALYATYRALPAHEQTRLKMTVLRTSANTAKKLAEQIGRVAIDLEKAYYRETVSNG